MLAPEQITTDLIGTPESHPFYYLMVEVVRKVVDEVRKQDTELIRQMLEALKNCRATGALDDQAHDLASAAITAARARLENT